MESSEYPPHQSSSGASSGASSDGLGKSDETQVPPSPTLLSKEILDNAAINAPNPVELPVYRLYKQRFAGLVALVFLNIITAMSWSWFGPISTQASADFRITLEEVNWLGNIVSCVYLPTSLLVPVVVSKYGISRCCQIGAAALILSAWIRYAGTVHTLTGDRAYALLIIGQVFAAIAQPIYQVLGPKYSEIWFDLKGRTTATTVIAISNPIGSAIGQLISPLVGNTRQSILVLGIMSTAVTPFVFFVANAPPTPPTYAGSKASGSLLSLLRAIVGKVDESSDAYMSPRSRLDFAITTLIFGVFVASANAFAILTNEIFEPAGYSEVISGLLGACLLLTGIVAAIITAPLFDRVLTHHLAITAKILAPPLAGAWLSLIWAVKPNDTGGLFAIMTTLGVTSITLLPVGLELGVELTKNADGSSAILWFMGNLIGIISVLVQQALRAGPNASPPNNMRNALIFNGVLVSSAAVTVFPLRGKQERKRLDEEMFRESERISRSHQAGDTT
ncbi:hypothetical protein AX15_003247 [Amanita polypyramis BW_CC]|nr:hypothetical protein AX15_003247 [Amanita polypyramis BW_CC]